MYRARLARAFAALLVPAAVVFVLAAREARATVALRLTLDELTQHAGLVVRARCGQPVARFNAARSQIWTHHPLAILALYRAQGARAGGVAVGQSLDVVTRGGRVGRVAQRVSGTAHGALGAGREVVVFLFRDGAGRWQVVGMIQGVFAVTRPGGGEAPAVANGYAGLCVVERRTLKPADAASSRPMRLTLAALVASIRKSERPKPAAPKKAKPEPAKPQEPAAPQNGTRPQAKGGA